MTDGGFEVDPDEIDAHAKQVDATLRELKTAADADQSRVDGLAFGLVGNLMGLHLLCDSTTERAMDQLRVAVEAGDRHVRAVQTWARQKRVDEETVQELLEKAEGNG
jgi:hypothetical protein